jgi:hypothetical protein
MAFNCLSVNFMHKDEFLNLSQTKDFVKYFGDLITKKTNLNFVYSSGRYESFDEALSAYRWPNKRVDISTPDGVLVIGANSNFNENKIVLDKLGKGIKRSFEKNDTEAVAAWSQSIMVWGGVYTRRGNAAWLDENRLSINEYLRSSISVLNQDDDEAPLQMPNLRSNAGTTKIYSLLLPNFIIYDSRVSAALAWLVFQWAQKNSIDVADYLRFSCMRANSKRKKIRSPDEKIFKYFAATGKFHYRHAMWNLRANWVVEAALKYSQAQDGIPIDSRSIEAALFMLGADLSGNL